MIIGMAGRKGRSEEREGGGERGSPGKAEGGAWLE